MAPTSASATSTPSTFASPLNHHMLRRLLSLRHVVLDDVAGHDGLAELALSIGHEEHLLRPLLSRPSFERTQIAPAVCAMPSIREHAREHRPRREMAHELRLVEGDVLDADAGAVAVDLDDAVDEQERIAVRQQLHDAAGCRRDSKLVGASVIRASAGPRAGRARLLGRGRAVVFGENASRCKLFQGRHLAEPVPDGLAPACRPSARPAARRC